jgi:hypothetical protein
LDAINVVYKQTDDVMSEKSRDISSSSSRMTGALMTFPAAGGCDEFGVGLTVHSEHDVNWS